MYTSKDVFAAADETMRSAASEFTLVDRNLANIKPPVLTVRILFHF